MLSSVVFSAAHAMSTWLAVTVAPEQLGLVDKVLIVRLTVVVLQNSDYWHDYKNANDKIRESRASAKLFDGRLGHTSSALPCLISELSCRTNSPVCWCHGLSCLGTGLRTCRQADSCSADPTVEQHHLLGHARSHAHVHFLPHCSAKFPERERER